MKFNTKKTVITCLGAITTALILAACGGGGSSSSVTNPPPTSSAKPLLSIGNITGFGSVVVNGVRYDSTSVMAKFDDNEDAVGTDNDGMQIGMNAEIKGSVNDDKVSGKADEIYIESMVRGPAVTVTPAATGNGGTIEAMGSKIVADDTTTYYNITKVADLKVGDIVNVHGLLNADGSVQAKFLEKRDPLLVKKFKAYGKTASSDTAGMKFKLGALTVSYDATTKLKNLPAGISDGLLVRVSGLATDYDKTTNTLKAASVKQVMPFSDYGMNEGEIKGPIADLSTDKLSFTVNGTKVMVDTATVYKYGTSMDLLNGTVVEVEGAVTNGVLAAKEVEFKKPEMEMKEVHGAISLFKATTTPVGFSFTVHGQEVQTDNKTVIKLKVVTALADGVKVEVNGTTISNGVLLATKVTEETK
jgi:Domain of unknown function (DUF5666)